MSKDRGIIFQAWGVAAIRNMRPGVWPAEAIDHAKPIKSTTRRMRGLGVINKRPDDWRFEGWASLKEGVGLFGDMAASTPTQIEIKCPYGIPGDILWVRETHYRLGRWVKDGFTKTGRQRWRFKHAKGKHVRYIDNPPARLGRKRGTRRNQWWKRPSIFMPRWASREDLVVKEVDVERVQDITWLDALAEGVDVEAVRPVDEAGVPHGMGDCDLAIPAFRKLWNAINDKLGFAWKSNPCLWVVRYMRI